MDPSIRPITDADRFNTHELFTDYDPPETIPESIRKDGTGKIIISMCKHCRLWGERLFNQACEGKQS